MLLKKFGYQTDSLTAYVNEQSMDLLTKATFTGKSAQMFTKQPGIKSAEALQLFEVDVYMQAEGADCAFTPSGNQEFTQRILTVDKLKIQDEYCPKKLEAFWTQKALTTGSSYDKLAFEADWTEFVTRKIGEKMEQMIWRGNKVSGAGDFALMNGFIKIIDDASALTVNGNTGNVTVGTGIVAGNVIAIHDAIWQVIPAALYGESDLVIMEGWDTFNTLIVALKNANLYHYDGVSGNPQTTGSLILPGTGYRIEALHGLTGTNRIFAGKTSNFFIGVDLDGEEDQFDIRDNPITKSIMLDAHFKLGTQIAFPSEVVSFKLVP